MITIKPLRLGTSRGKRKMDLEYLVMSKLSLSKSRLERTARRPSPFEVGDDPTVFGDGTIMGGALGAGQGEPAAKTVLLEATKLSEAQASEAARDPDNVVAPVMPVSFIAPCSLADYGMVSDGDPVAAAVGAGSAWGIAGVGADLSDFTGKGVTVAVLDTGIDAKHPAFAGVKLVPKNFTGGDPDDVDDVQGHGTHCAGTIFGRDVDRVRIGIARGVAKAVIGKVLDDSGRGTTASVLKALHWAGENGANVVSMSLGFDFPGMQEQLVQSGRPARIATSMALKAYRENLNLFGALIDFLTQEGAASPGMVVVAASGNESMRHLDPNFVIDTSLPASASAEIVSVGAIGRSGANFSIAPFSNVNPKLCAPGVDIVSAKAKGRLVVMSGTSMACPHVAGLAALWWERAARNGPVKADAVRARLIASAMAEGFADGVTFADRGEGRATAPKAA